MIVQLVRQDPVFRRLPVWAAIALVQVGVAAAVLAWTTSRGTSMGLAAAAALIWFPVTLFLIFGEIGTRASQFHLALPLAARQLWLSHLVAVGLTGVAVLAIAATLTTSVLVLQRRLVDGELIGVGTMVVGGGLLVAGLIFAVVLLNAFRPGAQEVPLSVRRVGWSLLAAVASGGTALVLWPLGPAGIVVLVVLAAIVFASVYRRVPVALALPERARHAAAPEVAVPGSVGEWRVATEGFGLLMSLRTVHGVSTCAKKSFVLWIVVPFIVFLSFLMSVDTRPSSDRFGYPFMLVYVIMVVTAISVVRLGVIDWMPWSRRRTYALMTLPFLLSVAVGYGAGTVAQSMGVRIFGGGELLCMSKNRSTGEYYLCIVPAASRLSWSGSPPEITTPWGETREPYSRPVIRGLAPRAYFPYSVHSGSSPEFAALQISRAVEDLFGATIPPDEIQSRYLRERAGGTVAPVETGLTIQADYPELRLAGAGVYFPWLMAAVVALWGLLMAGFMVFLRGGVSARRRKVLTWVFIALPMVLWILNMYLEVFGISTTTARNTFFIALSRAADRTVAGTVSVWVGSALIAWGAYWLSQRRFERAELNPDPAEICSVD